MRNAFFRRIGVDVGEGAVAGVIQPAGSRYLLIQQDARDLGSARTMKSKVENLFHDPAGPLVNDQTVLYLRVALVAQRRVGKGASSGQKLGVEGVLDLAACVLCEPFIE